MSPIFKRIASIFALAVVLSYAPAQAQFFHVTGTSPGQNSINISPETAIGVLFDNPVMTSTVNQYSFVVQGNMTGYHLGTYTFTNSDQTVIFSPDLPFARGEVVTVSLTSSLVGVGVPTPYIAHPYIFTFTTAAGPGPGSMLQPANYSIGFTPYSMCMADYDHDNTIDVAVAGAVDYLKIFGNSGDGSLVEMGMYPMGSYPLSLITYNINRDGDLDLVAANWYNDSITIVEGVGDGDFLYNSSKLVGTTPSSVCASDFNGSGYLDLAVAGWQSQDVIVFVNMNGDSLGYPTAYDTYSNPRSIVASDVDNDWDMDIVVANQGANSVAILYNGGYGVFSLGSPIPVGGQPMAVTAANLDNNGYQDIAVVNFIDNTVTVLLRDGLGTVSNTYPVGAAPRSIVASDIGGDGDLDLIVCNQNDSTISILLNGGDGQFAPQQVFSTGGGPYAMSAADLDNDGDIDLATANFYSQDVTVLQPMPMVVVMYMEPGNAVNMLITDPDGLRLGYDEIGVFYNEIPGGSYDQGYDYALDSAVIPQPAEGQFTIQFFQQPLKAPITTYSAIIKIDGSLEAVAVDNATADKQAIYEYTYDVAPGYHYRNGDANRDEIVNIGDAVFIINYVFKGGPESYPVYASDANCDQSVNIGDTVYLINFIFKGGNKPCCCSLCGDECQ